MNVGVFLPNWIGDTVMATPALRALRKHIGLRGRLFGVLRPYLADVLAGTSWLDEMIFFDPRAKARERRAGAAIRQLRAARLDAIVLLTNSLRTGLMAWASRVPRRIGFARHGRGLLLTDRLQAPRDGRRLTPFSAVDAYRRLASAFGCADESPRLELATLPADEEAADRVWQRLGLPTGDQVVVLNSGGAYGAAKHWPSEHFAALARRLATDDRLTVLVNCGPSERELAAQIVRQASHPGVTSLADEAQLPIGLTKACIRRSRLLVSTDSGPRFFAVAFGVPVVALFGPTHPEWSRTDWPGEVVLQHQVPCGPCMRRTCPLGHHQCMRDLSVERVYGAVRQQLAPARTHAA